ncbi:hypothetical protein Trydic_g6088 [Trypoxylus dichotomus]
MEFNVEARKLQLQSWNVKDTLQDNQFITCSLDPSHKVPWKVVDNHIKKCTLRKEGYDLNEEFLSEPQQGASSMHIDDHKKIEILSAAHKTIENFKSGWNGQDPDPKTSNRLTSTFSTDERLALYDYAITNTTGPAKLPEFDIFSAKPKRDGDKPLSYEEKLALERDLKRRKIKYRSVHTSHKNHTEKLKRQNWNVNMLEQAQSVETVIPPAVQKATVGGLMRKIMRKSEIADQDHEKQALIENPKNQSINQIDIEDDQGRMIATTIDVEMTDVKEIRRDIINVTIEDEVHMTDTNGTNIGEVVVENEEDHQKDVIMVAGIIGIKS